MSCDLLVIDPSESSSMLGPLFALEVFLARPHRWDASFLDTSFSGIKTLPNSCLETVLKAWAKERGLRFSTIGADEPLQAQIQAVVLFGNDASAAMRAIMSALAIRTVVIDLESGSFLGNTEEIVHASPMLLSPPSSPNVRRADERH